MFLYCLFHQRSDHWVPICGGVREGIMAVGLSEMRYSFIALNHAIGHGNFYRPNLTSR